MRKKDEQKKQLFILHRCTNETGGIISLFLHPKVFMSVIVHSVFSLDYTLVFRCHKYSSVRLTACDY